MAEGAGDPDPKAAEELLALVYGELRSLAAARLAGEGANGHTLQPTALVHEAWLRLVGSEQQTFQNRAHFFAAAAEAMRRILIDNARRKQTVKRGSGARAISLDSIDVAQETEPVALLHVDEALTLLAARDAEAAKLIQLRFFTGLGYEEAARVMGISERTAKRLWTFGRAWLYRELAKDLSPAPLPPSGEG